MLGKTHITVGVAASLAILQPDTAVSCACVAAGGALGGWINDVDVRVNRRNAIEGAIMTLVIFAAIAGMDYLVGIDLYRVILNSFAPSTVLGAIGFAATTILGANTNHRSFTHSILGVGAWSIFLWMALPPLAPAFAIGAASHIVLDLLNYQNVKLFYPLKKGLSLDLCSSSGLTNKILGSVGFVLSVVLFVYFLVTSVLSDIGAAGLLGEFFSSFGAQ